jgi:Putative Actinobacterial Holin-X, holin superfamily III
MSQTTVRGPSTWSRPGAFEYSGAAFEPTGAPNGRSIRSLLGELSREVATLARQEVALAKAELSEKARVAGRNAIYLAIGGLVAYAGFLVLLAAVAMGIGAWMARADVSPGVFVWLAPLIVAVVVLGAGGALIAKAIMTIKEEGLAPTRTAESIRDAKEFVKEKIS